MRRRVPPFALAAMVYVLLTVALTWPLALHPRSLVPSDLGDPLLNVWIMWWNTQAIPLTTEWWNAPQFYPTEGALAFSEHLLGLAPLSTPVILATGDALLAYNIAFFLAFPLCALAAHFLVFSIARRHDVAFVAGLAFAFAPYRLPQIAHVQVLSAYWMPLALAGLHRYFEERRTRWLVLFAGAWLWQALACGYYFFFLSVLIGLWLAWFALFRGRVRDLVRVAAAWAVAVLLLAPVLYGYWHFTRAYNLQRTVTEIRSYSADIASVLTASTLSRTWGWLQVTARPESDLFPGLTVVLLSVVAVVLAWRVASRESTGHPHAARWVLALAGVAGAISIARLLYGPFRLEIAGVRLLSVTSPEKPITVAVACLTVAALLHPAVRTAWRRRSPLAFYALATVAMWLFSLGPSPTLFNEPALYKAPYAWLMVIPGLDGVRVPARFWMVGTLCLAVTAALGLRVILQRFPRAARVLPALAIAGVAIDGWPNPLPMEPRPQERPNHAAADVRLDLPLSPSADTLALYRAASHGRPLINGYSGYFAPHYWAMQQVLLDGNAGAVERLAEYGSIEIMIDHALDQDGAWRAFAGSVPGAEVVHVGPDYTSYLVPRRAGKTASAIAGNLVPFTVVSASVRPDLGATIHDDDLMTRWHGGREQNRGDSLTIDLGSERELTGVELLLGGYLGDYPRGLEIAASADADQWRVVWEGSGGMLAFSGGLDRPREMPLSVPLAPDRARYLRFTQTGTELVHYWSIAELRVFGK